MDDTLIDQALAARPGHILNPLPARLVVGFSGGLDSTVLLQLAQHWQQRHPSVSLLALHVNHQLHPLADQWQQQCTDLCARWNIPLVSEAVTVDRAAASLEQSARDARYGAFRRHLRPDDLLLLAHHRDDQVETLLQRLLRGSGPLGIGGMGMFSQQRGLNIARPLLETDRTTLEAYAAHQGLTWIDDPANQNPRFERNFLRHRVLPLLRERWPQLNQTLSRTGRLSREAAELLDDLAQLDRGDPRPDGGLPVHALTALSQSRARNLIRYWLRQQGASLPSAVQLQRVLDEIVPAAADARPELVWGGQAIRRYQGMLYCVPELPDSAGPIAWSVAAPLPSLDVGTLFSQEGQGTAFSRTRLTHAALELRFRQGGEQARPAGRHTRSLKQWLQDTQVPPWWRDHLPLLYCDDELAGLPGLFACSGFEPRDEADSLWLNWHPPGLVDLLR